MINSFKELGITTPILKALEEMGFDKPTEVQSLAIPHALNKEDLIVMSKTGSGKTAVFGVSMLQMTDPVAAGPQGLILTPTRELAVQVDSDLKKMAKFLQHKTTAVYGQHSMNVEIQALNKGISIVTGTPGRVFDHITHRNLSTRNIRFLVLDEADRMLDMGFIDQVERIIKTLPKDRITLLFSATIPAEIRKICTEYMKHPVTVEIESQTKTVDIIRQIYYRVEKNEKRTQLNRILLLEHPESCMIFCNTRVAVDQVQMFLSRKGYACEALHGDIPQSKRIKTIQQFKQGEFHLLVATDVAARGIHIEGLSLVINYDVPVEKDSYVHRIGRTGRAGNEGLAITMVTSDDIITLYEIEEHIGAMISEEELPTEAFFNENKDELEKWISQQAPKAKPPRATPEPGMHTTSKKPARTKPVQQGDKHTGKPDSAGAPYNRTSSTRVPERTPNRTPERPQARAYDNSPNRAPNRASNSTQNRVTDRAPSNRVPESAPNRAPYRTPNRTPNTAAKPVATRSTASNSAPARRSPENLQAEKAVPKKTFFQRLLQYIFRK